MLAMLKYIKPYSRSVVLIVILTLISTLLELLLPTLMANVVDIGIVNADIPYIVNTGGIMVGISLLAVVFTIAVIYLSAKVSLGFGKMVRRDLFVHVENFSLESFNKIGPASLITRTTNDIKQIQDVLNMTLRVMTRAPLMLVGGIILAVTREATLSLIFFVTLPLLVLGIFLIARNAIPLFTTLQQRTDRLNLVIRESLTGVRVIRAFNRVEAEKKRFDDANEAFRDTGIKVNKILSALFPFMMIIMNFTNVAIIWFGALRIDQGAMQVGNMMAFLQYAMMILISLIMLSLTFVMIPRAQASAKRVNEVLQLQAMITDPDVEVKDRGKKGLVEFRDVTFRYSGAEKPAVKNISFLCKPGETTAIVGGTGAGKSTLIQLILRFYDPESGVVLVNGVDTKQLTQKSLRQKIGYVPQKADLFNGTIAENIRFGKPEATDEEVLEVLQIAQAIDFVNEKEEGINSLLQQSGTNLSGGQKQRLSIARALLRKPEIYIFDDSFSALDYQTDAKLRKALKEYIQDGTMIYVGQRISTVQDADQIIVLDQGKIAGIGTHEELVRENTVYQEIVESQLFEEGGRR
ncbi:ABC transporter ATP-binding protein [Heliorestis acidaminivorans]|uniref:ABC transporter ATP-binding protein n=1 Tax=Heliorestis acidaminivorans TaxID=553427 RepID=A0A6I0F0T0_9FIRM|nr:ABC transporter ATP-binding protein [Heliorestis acidaminivorans]KAB2951964.1 ABC transporter ATP-binding protein [Heliorestis acidaminivorans]